MGESGISERDFGRLEAKVDTIIAELPRMRDAIHHSANALLRFEDLHERLEKVETQLALYERLRQRSIGFMVAMGSISGVSGMIGGAAAWTAATKIFGS